MPSVTYGHGGHSLYHLYYTEIQLFCYHLNSVLPFRAAAVFGEQKTEWELAPAGNKFKERTRIANYTGLPELMSMFKQVADVRTADTLDLATPEMKYHIENIEATEFQKTLVQELSDRADDVQSGNDPV